MNRKVISTYITVLLVCAVSAFLGGILGGCTTNKSTNKNAIMSNIPDKTVNDCIEELTASWPQADAEVMSMGVRQAASLWREQDGTPEEFTSFVKDNYEGTPEGREKLFNKLSTAMEVFNLNANQMTILLQKPTVLAGDEPSGIDYILGNYSASAHFLDDMFDNKVAFITMLNFPSFTLEQKEGRGAQWSRLEWGYARLGDLFTERIPARVNQQVQVAYGNAENYIADYNIMMGHLLTEDGRRLFPDDMVLLSHWNLRDELKSNYADVPFAGEKQEMIYKVMEHIACQTIPQAVINDPQYDWMPFSNRCFKDGEPVELPSEGDVRYGHILSQFHSYQTLDSCCPTMPDAIVRHFEGDLEMSASRIEELFVALLGSEQVTKVAQVIRQRLGRDLRPFDIWYDGFKSRSAMPEEVLTEKTRRLYPDAEAFHRDMPRQLRNLGFSEADARFIADRIVVEGARGSGHAWECCGRWEPARLRTRIGADGMDYKGYNIAVHEFGHNVEMVMDLYWIDHYMLYGVPNTAFTEALAFIFQARDLQLLGYGRHKLDDDAVLDKFWGMYEIMGVSLVDMYTWRWLYDHPQATAAELRDAVIDLAHQVWNRYYEPVLGSHDSPILAIYSHMVDVPMYLPAYPLGHLIQFQLEEHLAACGSGQEFASELERIYKQGRLTPDEWMRGAVGQAVSIEPVLSAVERIVE